VQNNHPYFGSEYALSHDLVPLWAVVFLAWVLTFLAVLSGQEHWLHYNALIEHNSLPLLLKLLLFVAVWQVMTAAMMLPSTLPMVHYCQSQSRTISASTGTLDIFVWLMH
jgi:hypothetical protein